MKEIDIGETKIKRMIAYRKEQNTMTKVYVASAFCKDKKGENKAGVVFDDNILSDDDKKNIAKQLGYAETAFISKSDKADYCIRYFTPAEEVPLCGHATIASFGVLNYLKMLDKEGYTIETKSGVLDILVKNGEIMMEQNIPTLQTRTDEELVEAISIKDEEKMEYMGAILYGNTEDVNEITGRFQLWTLE